MTSVARDVRARLAEVLDEASDTTLRELVDQVLSADKQGWATCPSCAKQVSVRIPDVVGRAKALEILANQGKGRPVERVHVDLSVSSDKPINEMTLGELEQVRLALHARNPELAASRERDLCDGYRVLALLVLHGAAALNGDGDARADFEGVIRERYRPLAAIMRESVTAAARFLKGVLDAKRVDELRALAEAGLPAEPPAAGPAKPLGPGVLPSDGVRRPRRRR
jgi:hypothetical protein